MSINWGAWAAGGMAARLASGHHNRMQSQGIVAIEPEQGMQALGSLLSGSQSQVGVFPINWSRFVSQLPSGQKIPFLSALISSTKNEQLLEQLKAAPPEQGEKILIDYLKNKISTILGINAAKIKIKQPLTSMGFDSLMAGELRNFIQREIEFDIPMKIIISGISIIEIANLLLEKNLLNQIIHKPKISLKIGKKLLYNFSRHF
ncbi:MAG: hypothetical protein F6K10_17510 [Moorea sp. SIO2B7]|nr:hypothetical protein [Moorena sp. SIO2B7]